MRRVILLFSAVLLGSNGWSQTLNIHYKNGQSVQFDAENIEYVEFTEKAENNTSVTAGDAIDLGLSVKWASCNVGATSPEEFGDKLAWGETSTKNRYSSTTYIYYNEQTESYMNIGIDIKSTDYDAAYIKWGGIWRMPTDKELRELKNNCNWEWAQINGVNGYKVTGKNGNSIFLPYAKEFTIFWASTLSSQNGTNMYANVLAFTNGGQFYDSYMRYVGGYVRPVCPK